ncbi:hypothetical protein GCM10010112_26010 [Actinoplanes lobatus]|uniref:Knr4/Smi1-like domain-containing protein n=1 Tax=Actinoplanes lobatus TaxID=113568 RepID=A0A7W7HK36_9ACTN|nr:SMI1/KNR4 family protein [Actinoplanes lobatus]MBB4751642.1 hypothetical protein [Actinoplanes lobatus]GGN65087.1 hypothetical protein GCM10010112_26010 [Actinoplanes lobatus]GIE43226.1 hypothetical protein Alo02nite_61240 [Actinoplanes lobatus]
MDFDAFVAEVEQVRAAKGVHPPFEAWIASDADLARVEATLRTRLPEKYKQFMKVFGAGQFMYLGFIPPVSPDGRIRGLIEKNTGEHEIPGFVAIAAVGTGDHWGFVNVDGVCSEQVYMYTFEDESLELEADDFLAFASWEGLHAGREGY